MIVVIRMIEDYFEHFKTGVSNFRGTVMNSTGATKNGILNGNLRMSYSQSFLQFNGHGFLTRDCIKDYTKQQTPMSIIKGSFMRIEMTAAHMAPGNNKIKSYRFGPFEAFSSAGP